MTVCIPDFETVFVARQPVFRADETVWGYELLFRSCEDNMACIADEDHATSSVIVDGMALAAEGMPPDARILINFPQQLLVEDGGFALPKDRCVVEILEHVTPSKETLEATKRLKNAGYMIAVDDYFGQASLKPFIDLADIVKVDVLEMGCDSEKVADAVKTIPDGITLLAEKVEDNESFHMLQGMGFSLFQGFFFSKPEIVPGKKLTANEMTKLQLLAELCKVDLEPARLAEILQSDPSLSYRLFRYINSAGMGLSQKVSSPKRAIDMMGLVQAKQWLRSVLMADLNTTPKAGELAYLAVHRAKFLESVCGHSNQSTCEPDNLFMTGLFSLLDSMLHISMDEIIEMLPLEESVVKALRGEGEVYKLLRLATDYERGEWGGISSRLKRLGLETFQAELMYVQARSWTQKMLGYCKPGQGAA
ncbi:EAL domain-containing protein [uncultured Pseudodesulfovibrio sp.]|uniref:EAL and HDOD domain-containing protein n=1 Tax=uncultured Pseudodesulfovibrio sp. TaxID=2035858 RepID=UPI0029C858CE|nr:EAL domain-containing protein [uncultured Pseudodesulfovibrio sp.]